MNPKEITPAQESAIAAAREKVFALQEEQDQIFAALAAELEVPPERGRLNDYLFDYIFNSDKDVDNSFLDYLARHGY